MNLDKLLENHTYLIRKSFNTELNSITVLCITKEAYKLRWNNDNNYTYTNWNLIKDFDDDYRLVEDITEVFEQRFEEKSDTRDIWFDKDWVASFFDIKKFNNVKSKLHPYFIIQETCPACNGAGTAKSLNNGTTSIGLVTCPTCQGSKTVSKRIDIFFD
jgi:RecJ-like exonuclease